MSGILAANTIKPPNCQENDTDFACLSQLEQLSVALSADGEYIDWRAFLLVAAHPWLVPTQTQLLTALANFKEMDQKDTGCVTREQYDRVCHFHKFGL